MISLNISDEIIKKHRHYMIETYDLDKIKKLEANILAKQKKVKAKEVKDFFDWLKKQYDLLSDEKKYSESIFLCEPDKLKKNCNYISKLYKWIFDDYAEQIVDLLGYDDFSQKSMMKGSDIPEEGISQINYSEVEKNTSWSAYAFVMQMDVKVCPYCNRNYITPLMMKDAKERGDLDHFLPKSKYPFLAMSIYNLVPCCKVCNLSLKARQDFSYEKNVSPYEQEAIEEAYKFTYIPHSYEDIYSQIDKKIDICIQYSLDNADLSDRLKNNMNTFKIKEIYGYHSDVIRRMIIQKCIYPKEYLETIEKNYKCIFNGEESDMQNIIFDLPSKSKIKNTILGKLKFDIMKELNEI